MNCTNCYQEIPDGSRFCPHCGAKQPEPAAQTETDQSASDAYSTYTPASIRPHRYISRHMSRKNRSTGCRILYFLLYRQYAAVFRLV